MSARFALSTPVSGAPETAPAGARLSVSGLVVERIEAGRPAGRILDRVDLTAAPGEVVAITGASGAGKTTLLHAIAGLIRADAGRVAFGDTDVTALTQAQRDRWRRDAVGLVFQDFQLVAELGVVDNILLPITFDHYRTPPALAARTQALATRVGLDGRGLRAGTLSRGEQQRVAIARALVRSPQLILADEPTASLDADNGARIADLLIETARDAGASLVIVSHDPVLLARAGRVERLVAGQFQCPRGVTP